MFFVDERTFLADPGQVESVLGAYDEACARPDVGGARNTTKTVVTLSVTEKQIAENAWDLEAIRRRATLHAP